MQSILLVENNPPFRTELKRIIDNERDFKVLEEVGNVSQTAKVVHHVRPDILVIDLDMPEVDCGSLIRYVKQIHPLLRLIGISVYAEIHFAADLLKGGADAYILKDQVLDDLILAMRYSGYFLSSQVSRRLFSDLIVRQMVHNGHTTLLSEFEKKEARLLARGLSLTELKDFMHLSMDTAKFHYYRLVKRWIEAV